MLFNQNFAAMRLEWSHSLFILRFLSILSDAFTHLPEKMCEISDKISHRRNVNASDCFLKQSATVVLNGKTDDWPAYNL